MSAGPLRVLFLTHSYPRVPGDAAGSFLWHLAVALKHEEVQVRVIAPSAPGLPAHDVFDGIPVDRFRYAPGRHENLAYTGNMVQEVRDSWSARFALVGFLGAQVAATSRLRREFAPHLIHAHWWFPGGLAGAWAARLAGLPLVTTMHGSDVRLARAKHFARPLFRHVMKQSRAVTTVSRWLADEVADIAPATRVTVAPMPVSTSTFAPQAGSVRDRLLFVGRLNAQKGIADLVEALGQMRSGISLDVVGDGPDRERLQARARELRVDTRVTWHGQLPQPALLPFYQRAGVLVVPSIGEGLGLVAVEAQLCETPVVAYASGGTTDTVLDGETGILVPPGDVATLAAALDQLMGNTELRNRYGAAGRTNALALFSPESAARRYADLYRQVLQEGGRAPFR